MKNLIFVLAFFGVFGFGMAQEPDAALYEEIVKAQKESHIKLTPEELKLYEGDFEMEKNFILTFYQKDGVLMSQATGQPAHPMIAQGNHKFIPSTFPATATFVANSQGIFDKLILTQSGREFVALKIN